MRALQGAQAWTLNPRPQTLASAWLDTGGIRASGGTVFISVCVGWLCVFEGRPCILAALLHMVVSVLYEMRTHSSRHASRHCHTSAAHRRFISGEGLGRRVSL